LIPIGAINLHCMRHRRGRKRVGEKEREREHTDRQRQSEDGMRDHAQVATMVLPQQLS
jgi:hypothetical protein